MKKLLAILLVLMVVMTGCGRNTEEDMKAVRETVESCFDSLVNFDFEKIKDFFVDENDIPKEISELDVAAEFEKLMGNMPAELEEFSPEFEEMMYYAFDKIKSECSYEITDIVRDKSTRYIVSMNLTLPDVEKVDFEKLITDSFDEQIVTDTLMEMANEGKLTASSSEQEMMALVMPKMVEIIKATIDGIEFETTTESFEFPVKLQDDGRWMFEW